MKIRLSALLLALLLVCGCYAPPDVTNDAAPAGGASPAPAPPPHRLGSTAPTVSWGFIHRAPAYTSFSTALEASHVIKAAPGIFYTVSARLDSTAPTLTYYLQVFDASSAPSDTTAISAASAMCAPVKVQHTSGTDDNINIDLGDGVQAAAGITVVLSTTEFTKTISGTYLSIVQSSFL